MLNECLSIGRSITLPSTASGGAKAGAVVTGAYARIRKQFGLSIGRFEGVEEALARIGGKAYAISALSQATAAAVDRGEVPAVPSAIAKYHCTDHGPRSRHRRDGRASAARASSWGRATSLGRAWQASPIAITVEGANIMTRSLMIFGQGAILCHPWVMKEMKAAGNPDFKAGLRGIRPQPVRPHRLRHFQRGALVLVRPDRREDRFGAGRRLHPPLLPQARPLFREPRPDGRHLDAVARRQAEVQGIAVRPPRRRAQPRSTSTSAMLKRYEDEGAPAADQPLLAWAFHDSVHKIELALSGALRNFPIRPVGWLLWALVFPWGRRAAGAERPPGPPRRRAPDDAERSARSPWQRRVPDARARTIRPAASTATCPR